MSRKAIAARESDEWLEWRRLTPQPRWAATDGLWAFYREAGGSFDPEPDSQSPFDIARLPGEISAHGRPGLRVLRRGREGDLAEALRQEELAERARDAAYRLPLRRELEALRWRS